MSYETPQMYRWRDPSWPQQIPSLSVHFLEEPQINQEVTAATGVQTYDNVLIAYVAPMGMPKSNVAHEVERKLPDGTVKVNGEIANKYGEQLKLYKAGHSSEAQGTPLKDLIGMTPATAMSLRARGIHTVEMLADMGDGASGDLMGFWDLRERARKHIELREKNAPTVRLESELASRDKTIADMQNQIDELTKLVGKKARKTAEAEAA